MYKNIFVLFSVLVSALALTTEQVDEVKNFVNTLINDNADNGRLPYIATIVRLAFHDCNGGCDGCVDMSNPSNAGLGVLIDDLNNLYTAEGIDNLMSRADFYALAGITAVELAGQKQRGCRRGCTLPPLVFKTGRKTAENCETSPPSRNFPNAHDGNAKTVEFFNKEFGFTANETVALLGAHTLGRASAENSGFRGPWVTGTDRLDNEYYADMVNAGLNWGQVNVARRNEEPRFQWNHNGTRGGPMMLNSDMCLLIDFPVNSDGSVTECTYGDCSKASNTEAMVNRYAVDNDSFIQNFFAVFQKMIDHTPETLTEVGAENKRSLEKLLTMLLRAMEK